jgi:KAP-like P-loop domain-containing protein
MNLLAADLRANGFRPVFFNAWHSQQEASVLASLLEAIRKKGLPSVSTVEGLLFRAALLLRRCRRHWIFLSLLGVFFAASAGLLEVRPPWLTDLWSSFVGSLPAFARAVTAHSGKDAGDAPGWVAFAAASIAAAGFLAKSLKAFGLKPEEILAYKGAEGRKPRPYHLRFADQFHDVAAALAPRRMVIFVDDLDRCRPQYVLDTLEAINFLVSSGECFIVMGLAPDQVKAAVGLAFKDIADEMVKLQPVPPVAGVDPKDEQGRERREHCAREYLYKLVNLEIPVAEVGAAAAVNVLAGVGVETKGDVGRMAAWRPYAAVAAFVALLAGSFFVAQRAATDIQAGLDQRKVTLEPVAREKTTPPPRVIGGQAAVLPEVGHGAGAPADTIGHPPGVVPPTKPTPHPVRYLLAIPLAVALFASMIWVLRFRISIIVSDSDEFTRALAHWQPVLSQLFTTPRALKRFLNRLRYFAMLQRKEPPERSVWGAITGRSWRKTTPSEVVETGIRESALVALAALDAAGQQPRVRGVEDCKAAHTAKFGDSLDEGQRLLFATLSQGVKVG